MSIQRVAVIYDDRNRPETTGGYCTRAFGDLVRPTHIRPDLSHQVSPLDFDLFVRIDDGLDHPLPPNLRPLAWWAIDTHLEFDRCLAQASTADLTFAAQKSGAAALRKAGVETASWLPLACDPTIHRKHNVPITYDVAFVGNVFPGPRSELLGLLRRRYPRHFVGKAYFEDMARAYSASLTAFNRSIRDDLNMRVFEALACGALLLTNDLPESGQPELFRDGAHLATYQDADELLDKLAFYLERPSARSRIANAGREEVVGKHTYRHRMEQILAAADAIPRPTPVSVDTRGGPAVTVLPTFGLSYFEFDRPELLALIPSDATDVVDIGCGAGRLGVTLKGRQNVRVIGVEKDPHAAAVARSRLDLVLEADVETIDWPFPPASMDVIVCGDVLEHLRDPLAFLRRARTWLRPSGRLVTSLPNVRHHSVVRSLLNGDWTYEPAGLLDHTHLRFFTRREVEKLLHRAGFEVPRLIPAPGPGYEQWEAAGRPGAVGVGGLQIGPLAVDEAEEFYTYQWLSAAHPAKIPDRGITSIVILAHNELPYTRQCIDSIRLLTDEPFELVLVDNGSTDATANYFRALATTDSRVQIVLNPDNRGFPVGANQGIRASSGRQVLLLNNDTVVTTGWLGRMLQALDGDPAVGLVGPSSNRVSGPQQVPVDYGGDLQGLDGFAWRWGKKHSGVIEKVDRLVGFCLLVRREVIDTIGMLDEGFGIGNFEDDDYCLRAHQAGFHAVIVRGAFVHHVGGQTFRGAGIDYAGLFRANQWRFEGKWKGTTAVEPRPVVPATPKDTPTLKVLLLAHVGLFRDRMDKSHFYRYEALAKRPGVTVFGPGFPGYRQGMTIRETVDGVCGGQWPDVVIHGCDPRSSGVPLVSGLADAPILTAIELLDSWVFEDRQIKFIRRNRFALGLIQEAAHHIEFYRTHCPEVEFAWTPNGVNTDLFSDHGLPKEYDIILYGATNPEVYPFRARLAKLLAKQTEFRVIQLSHPGYYPTGEGATAVVSGKELSRLINRAWIGIATKSIYNCFLMKYLEIAASGTLVAGDLPDAAREVFTGHFLELDIGDTDGDILGKFRTILADKSRLGEMSRTARGRVISEYSTEAFADRVLAILVAKVRQRQQGGTRLSSDLSKYAQSHGAPASAAEAGPPFLLAHNPEPGLLIRRGRPTLSGCLIVRDNARTIQACLESLKPWVDELVVVDTGSKDETPQIAAGLGARVFRFPWCDDFSAARNESVRHAHGRWIFWMDSDDTINELNGRGLRALADGRHDEKILGYVMQVHCPGPGPNGEGELTVVDHVKLFRNRADLRFEGRIHEQILPAVRRAGGDVAWTDLFVVHSGYDHSPKGQEQKKERDLRLLGLELAERPNHPFTLFNLGMTYADIGRHGEAVMNLEASIRNSGPGESHLRKAYALLAFSLFSTGRTSEAFGACEKGLKEFPDDLELEFRRGVLLHALGRLDESVAAYRRVLSDPVKRYFTSVDRGLRGYKAHQNLAAVYADLGDWGLAEAEWRAVIADASWYRVGWRGLGEVLLRQGKFDEAATVAQRLRKDGKLPGEGRLLAGRVAAAMGRRDEAIREWEAASEEDRTEPEPLRHLGRLYFEAVDDKAAERVLRALLHRDPDDPAAHHNLGSVLLRQNRAVEAIRAFRQSLELRPGSIETRMCLGYALQAAGDLQGAAEVWQAILARDPGNGEAIEAVRTLRASVR